MNRPNPAASAALLAQGIDEALAAHGVPPRPKRNDLTESRGPDFAAQARRARETAADLVDVDRLTYRNNNTH